MIGRISGTVIEATPLSVVVDVGGLGYELSIPVTTAEQLPTTGKTCTLFTHAVYREDSAVLYGFATREDRDFFRLLVDKVSGIGPKIALGILSRMSVELLRSAIASSDVGLLSKCPGIGRKTAERLVIELKDKVGIPADVAASTGRPGETTSTAPSAYADAVSSLIALGYKPAEADKLARKAVADLGADAGVEEIVRRALS